MDSLKNLLQSTVKNIEVGKVIKKYKSNVFEVEISGSRTLVYSTIKDKLNYGTRVVLNNVDGKRFITGAMNKTQEQIIGVYKNG